MPSLVNVFLHIERFHMGNVYPPGMDFWPWCRPANSACISSPCFVLRKSDMEHRRQRTPAFVAQ